MSVAENPPTEATNPFPDDDERYQLILALQDGPATAQGLDAPVNAVIRTRIGSVDPAAQGSDATNANSPGYFENHLQKVVPIQRLMKDVSIDDSTRIVLKPAEPDSFQGLSRGLPDKWLELERPDDGGCVVKYLTIAQTTEDAMYIVQVGDFVCRLYFDSLSDSLAVENISPQAAGPVVLRPLGQVEDEDGQPIWDRNQLSRGVAVTVQPGAWLLSSPDGEPIMDFCLLPRRYKLLLVPVNNSLAPIDAKRGSSSTQQGTLPTKFLRTGSGQARRSRVEHSDEVSGTAESTELVAISSALQVSGAQETLQSIADIPQGKKAVILDASGAPEYSLFRMKLYKKSENTEVFSARHSSVPDRPIVVKVLKPRQRDDINNSKEIKFDASGWQNEYQIHQKLQSDSIVMLVGGDARFLTIYFEHIDQKDLSNWRDRDGLFTGSIDDARRVLRDMAGALHNLRQNNVLHNDIKAGNILYGGRGAVLIDFGLSTVDGSPASSGGTPWYVPPEYLYHSRRGAAADVWALGIVMLYLLRLIPLPELGQTVPQWLIRDVRKVGQARESMTEWLQLIEDVVLSMNNGELHGLVSAMLEADDEKRLTLEELRSRI